MLHDLACPTCGAPGLEAHQPDGMVVCKSCGNKFANADRVACPKCEAINPADSSFCKECGEKLKQPCPTCATENWAGADYCAKCGHNLNALEEMAQRHATGFKGTLQHQRSSANQLKVEEEAASQKRLGVLWETEKRRQDYLARQQAERNRQQTMLLIGVISIVAITLLGMVVIIILSQLK